MKRIFADEPQVDFTIHMNRNHEKVTTMRLTTECNILFSYGFMVAVIIEDEAYKYEHNISKTTDRHIQDFLGSLDPKKVSSRDLNTLIAKHIYSNIRKGLVL
jgi:hypothetical protein